MYLSFSGFNKYESCPSAYWHQYVGKTVLPTPDNRVNSLYGSTVGALFELFYTDQMWKSKTAGITLRDKAPAVLDRIIRKECSRNGRVSFDDPESNYASYEVLLEDIITTIPRGIRIIKHHRLLGWDVAAEVVLDHQIGNHLVGGRADFVIHLEKGLSIIDGKGSKHRERYVKNTQLLWYAMLLREIRGHLPDLLGFLYWRCDPETALDWLDFSTSQVDSLRDSVLDTATRIEADKKVLDIIDNQEERNQQRDVLFYPSTGSGCKLCAYSSVCSSGNNYLKAVENLPTFAVAEREFGL
jgi:hypothetical protein